MSTETEHLENGASADAERPSDATCSTENRQTPYFERRPGENIALVTEDFDEFGDIQKTRRLLSERSSKRLFSELADLL